MKQVANGLGSGPPECPPSAGTELSQALMEVDPPEVGRQPAPANAQPAPVAKSHPTDSRPTAPGPGPRPGTGSPGTGKPRGRAGLGVVRSLPLLATRPLWPVPPAACPLRGQREARPRRWCHA